ncbi:acid sugar phosphatase [Bacteroidia bacterium]|nr:acid sugar phosphatase [Bacteroidia bacterium]
MKEAFEQEMQRLREKKGFICDMDGVLYHGNHLLPGVLKFIEFLQKEGKNYLFLTNSSERTPMELSQKMARLGILVDETHFHTSALSTAHFLSKQRPGGSCYVIGEPALSNALYDVGLTTNDINPDYVVMGDTRDYNFAKIEHAVHLINQGAKLICCNFDLTGPTEKGIVPATRALAAPIELTTGVHAYYLGKPNSLMMRYARKRLQVHRDDAVIIGDRMDTDIVSGIEADIETVLVLSGVSTRETLKRFAYQPHHVLEGVGDILL